MQTSMGIALSLRLTMLGTLRCGPAAETHIIVLG